METLLLPFSPRFIVLTICVRLGILPLAIIQMRSMRGMQKIAPELQKLKQKHKGDSQKLQQETLASINAGRVPAPFQEHLASAANDLVSRIRCIPPAQPHDRGKHKGREKKKKQNEEND